MHEDDENRESFEETVRSIAHEVSQSVERMVTQVDLDEVAEAIDVDPARVRDWVDSAAGWMRGQVEHLGEEVASRAAEHGGAFTVEASLRSAAPHPLDLPTEEQGVALAALDSGRWTVEPGSNALAAQAEGPGPSDALGLVRELRVRDWIAADGEVTLAGRHALSRWLDAASLR